jgi:hypothetical protein
MTHLAMSEDLADGQQSLATEWGDHLTDAEYPAIDPNSRHTPSTDPNQTNDREEKP